MNYTMKKILIFTLVALAAVACNKPTNFVEVQTNYGNFTLELYDETPLHRDNFQKLVQDGFYNELLFHRIIDGFMIQGGDPDSKNAEAGMRLGSGGPGYKVPAELNMSDRCFHKKGALAAAREGDQGNPEKLSSGSQFFIVVGRTYSIPELEQMEKQKVSQARQRQFNLLSLEYMDTVELLQEQGNTVAVNALQQRILKQVDTAIEKDAKQYYMTDKQKMAYEVEGGTPHLDGNYTVYGEVIEGLEVVENIAKAK
jgi:peptidylprolyl isomerase